jgi:hypothetical protein
VRAHHGEHWTLIEGDCTAALKVLGANRLDSVVTDPPYELGFMAKAWDRTGVAFDPATWAEVLRVLKPGGHLLAFGGSRTYHRIACAIEDAGFEVRDCLQWLYGTGFPKSLNIGDGRGTALKPAYEPIILARKPLAGTVAANVATWGTGALNIDVSRIGTSKDVPVSPAKDRVGQVAKGDERGRSADTPGFDPNVGRWPANVLLDEEAAAELDAQSGTSKSTAASGVRRHGRSGGIMGDVGALRDGRAEGHNDSGGASRFFYVAKASRAERDAGCEHLPERTGGEMTDREDGSAGVNNPRAGAGRTGGARNFHPTVKPLALMRWLVRLVTPPGGLVLDPFTGSGTTGRAALLEGARFIGIEQSAEYLEIARARIQIPDSK